MVAEDAIEASLASANQIPKRHDQSSIIADSGNSRGKSLLRRKQGSLLVNSSTPLPISFRHKKTRVKHRRIALSTAILTLCALLCVLRLLHLSRYGGALLILWTDKQQHWFIRGNEISITVPYTRGVFNYPPRMKSLDRQRTEPDYGDLDFDDLTDDAFVRTIGAYDYAANELRRFRLLQEPSFLMVPPQFEPDDEVPQPQPCQRPKWRKTSYPTCNIVHETVYHAARDPYLGSGAFRQTWKLSDPEDFSFVLKHPLLPESDEDVKHTPTFLSFGQTQRDAIVMEQLTACPRVVNIYSYCGLTIASEAMVGDVTKAVIPKTGHATQADVDRNFGPRNNLTLTEKLDIALRMAESLADLHGYEGGTILHGDVHPDQWLQAPDGTIRLNDFNNAEFLEYSMDYGAYCKVRRGKWGGMVSGWDLRQRSVLVFSAPLQYRSPEELAGLPIDEKIDVFSMGNNLYTLLTGLWPFYEYKDYEVIEEKLVVNRETPFIDDRYRENSYIERKLVELMEWSWEYKPERRPTIFEMVDFLYEVRSHHAQRRRVRRSHDRHRALIHM